ncbi:MAG: hypothetical protein ABSE63_04575 [Thermoguttaceae bacterium]|jgi:hypothetical protein
MISSEKSPTRGMEKYPKREKIVDDFHTFFVGDQGILVHDNTPREPTAALVPGLLPQAPVADKNHPQK